MALLARTTASFDAIKPVPDLVKLDNELNQLVGSNGALNGGSTGNRILTKYNHATEPVTEADQLGAGFIAVFKQNGVEKARFSNDGSIVISNNAPQITLADVNDAKQMRIALDGVNWFFINDTLSANALVIDTTTNVPTFGQIPVLPATTPTTANQATRKQYVDDRTRFSISSGVADPSTAPVGAVIPGTVAFMCPDGSGVTLTKSHVTFQSGSHTVGGSVTFQFQKRTAASNWVTVTNFGDVTLDNTNNTGFVVYTNDFADVTLAPGDTLIAFISARSGTITERDVSVVVQGMRT